MSSAPATNHLPTTKFLILKQGNISPVVLQTNRSPFQPTTYLNQNNNNQTQVVSTGNSFRTLTLPPNLTSNSSTSGSNQILSIPNALMQQVPTICTAGVSSSSSSPIHLRFCTPPIQTVAGEHPNTFQQKTFTAICTSTTNVPSSQLQPYQPPIKIVRNSSSNPPLIGTITTPHLQQPRQLRPKGFLQMRQPQPNRIFTTTARIVPIPSVFSSSDSDSCDSSVDSPDNESSLDTSQVEVPKTELKAGMFLKQVKIPYVDQRGRRLHKTVFVPTPLPKNNSVNDKAAEHSEVALNEEKENKHDKIPQSAKFELSVGSAFDEDDWEKPCYDSSKNISTEDHELDPLQDPLAISIVDEKPVVSALKIEPEESDSSAGVPLISLAKTASAINYGGSQDSTNFATPEESDGNDQVDLVSPKGSILRNILLTKEASVPSEIKSEVDDDRSSHTEDFKLVEVPDFEFTSANMLVNCVPHSAPTCNPLTENELTQELKNVETEFQSIPSKGWNQFQENSNDEVGSNSNKSNQFPHGQVPLTLEDRPMDGEAKLLLCNVYKYFEMQKLKYNLSYNTTDVTCEATGIKSISTEQMLDKLYRTKENSAVIGQESEIPKMNQSNVMIDSCIRRSAQQSLVQMKSLTTIKHVLELCRRDAIFKGDVSSVAARLRAVGFEMVSGNKRKIHIEQPEIVAQRFHFLKEMSTLSEDPLVNIIYVLEVDLHRLKGRQIWGNYDLQEKTLDDVYSTTICHAVSANGLMKGALSIIETPKNALKNVSNEHSITWLKKQLLPNVPGGSIIVFGHPRHDIKEDAEPQPNYGYSKQQIVRWLTDRGVHDYDVSWPKAVLLQRCSKCKIEQTSAIDRLVRAHGCTPLHLPMHHRDLNPLELIWLNITKCLPRAKLKSNQKELSNFVKNKFAAVSLGTLKKVFEQVGELENIYRKNDQAIDQTITKTIRALKKGGHKQKTKQKLQPEDSEVTGEQPPQKKRRMSEEDIKPPRDSSS